MKNKYLLVTIVAGLILTVFGSLSMAQADLSGELTIAVESWMVDKFNINELINRFQTDHPDVTVSVINVDSPKDPVFLEWQQTGTATADIYFGGAIGQLAPAITDDLLLPWDDIMVGDLAPDKWLGGFLYYVDGPEGTNYPVLPGLGEMMSFQYNADLLVMAGVIEEGEAFAPETYDEIHDAICAANGLAVGDTTVVGAELHVGPNFALDDWQAAVVAAEGTSLDENGLPNWGSEASRTYLEFLKRTIDDGCSGTLTLTDTNAGRNGLKAGQVAIANETSSRANEASVALCPVASVPCPEGETVQQFGYPGGQGLVGAIHGIYIPRVAKHIDLARAFAVEQYFSNYAQTWSALNYGKLPTLKANFDALPSDNPNFSVLAPYLNSIEGPWDFRDVQFLDDTFGENLAAYVVGDITLDEMIDELNNALDEADLTTISELRAS